MLGRARGVLVFQEGEGDSLAALLALAIGSSGRVCI